MKLGRALRLPIGGVQSLHARVAAGASQFGPPACPARRHGDSGCRETVRTDGQDHACRHRCELRCRSRPVQSIARAWPQVRATLACPSACACGVVTKRDRFKWKPVRLREGSRSNSSGPRAPVLSLPKDSARSCLTTTCCCPGTQNSRPDRNPRPVPSVASPPSP